MAARGFRTGSSRHAMLAYGLFKLKAMEALQAHEKFYLSLEESQCGSFAHNKSYYQIILYGLSMGQGKHLIIF